LFKELNVPVFVAVFNVATLAPVFESTNKIVHEVIGQ
jgi:hypothetical protein